MTWETAKTDGHVPRGTCRDIFRLWMSLRDWIGGEIVRKPDTQFRQPRQIVGFFPLGGSERSPRREMSLEMSLRQRDIQ